VNIPSIAGVKYSRTSASRHSVKSLRRSPDCFSQPLSPLHTGHLMIESLGIRRILLATDFGQDSHAALQFAQHLAKQLEGSLHLISVLSPQQDNWGAVRERKYQLEQATSAVALDGLEIVAEPRIGRVDEEIVAYARLNHIDLIVLGTRGRSRWTKAIAGSIAEQVIRTAPCPVMIVPPWQTPATTDAVSEAARRLSVEFGPGLMGREDNSRARVSTFLARTFELTPPDVVHLIDQLESSGILHAHELATGDAASQGDRYWSIRSIPPNIASASRPLSSAVAVGPPESIALDLLHRAIQNRASDIHLDPRDHDQYTVRFRIDGRVEEFCRLDRALAAGLLQQYKVLAELDIADPFKPQEGRLRLPAEFAGYEVRLTSVPVQAGQAVALRLFSGERLLKPIEGLGLGGPALQAVCRMLQRGSGLILGTGPTGAGKTTLIYSLLNRLATSARNMISLEDPVEFPLPFLRQVAVDPRHGVTMTTGLRTILRMDPDIVFLSEIRDAEAAEAAMRAGSAGRFVFSTLHTRNVASTITGIRDLHIDSRSLAANLTGIISQRLVRRLCRDCCRESAPTETEVGLFRQHGLTPPSVVSCAAGCERCRGTGYLDRTGIFEAVAVTPRIAEAILSGASESEIEQRLREDGFPSLLGDALFKVSDGVTSIEEVLNANRLDQWVLPESR